MAKHSDDTTAAPTPGLEADRERAAAYFASTPAPKAIEGQRQRILEFLASHERVGKCLAVVTSGGTTVPLERNTVRFLDNFSTGSRGAASVESLLGLGYAVIYLHRPGSVAPFARHVQKATSSKGLDLDFLEHTGVTSARPTSSQAPPGVELRFDSDGDRRRVVRALQTHRQVVIEANGLLALPFTSVDDYFFLLRLVAECVAPWRQRVLFFLAAAVSDFFIPHATLAEHKLQSRDGPLRLELAQVPKLLGVLRHDWAPDAFFVSFKLETDWELLRRKARQAVAKYGMHVVVANELHTRFDEVLLITGAEDEEHVITRPTDAEDIEPALIDAVAGCHFAFISTQAVHIPEGVGQRLGVGARRPWRRRLPPRVQSLVALAEQHQDEILAVVLGGVISVMLNYLQSTMRRR